MSLWELTDLSTPWSIFVAATLRVPDHIEAGKTEIGALAAATGADTDSLQRVLQHLVSKGVFEEPEPGRFALNDAARELMTEGSRLVFNLDSLGGRMAHAWGTLLSAVRTGKPVYQELFGRTFWEDLEAHPQIAADFDALMGPAGHGVPDPQVLVDGNEWTAIRTVVDVGGGTGSLLAEILRAHAHVRGTLVDLPRAVARSAEVFEKAGVADRATAVAQSFFDPLPAAADVYVLKNVLGDWPDAEAQAILRRCAEAARPSGRVVTFGPGDKPSPELLMLVLVGGRGRSLEDFRKLAQGAGLEITGVGQQKSGRSIVECRPV
jgi:2,7-dihydroxy-5-methyl-1-naphthoate 7-O-methyltransferase